MIRHEAETWQEVGRLLISGIVVVTAEMSVWSYDGRWGGEALLNTNFPLVESDSAAVLLALEGEHQIEIKSVSHRSPGHTTIHFVGRGVPPWSPHAVPMTD